MRLALGTRLVIRPFRHLLQHSKSARRGEAAYRGFTLVELLAVVAVISVLAAISAPALVSVMRDRRVNRSALAIGEMYRLARSRALGRGAAVLVRWNVTGGSASNGLVEMREAVVSVATNPVPSSSCLTTDWANVDQWHRISQFETSSGLYELAGVKMFDDAAAEQSVGDICFSPRGRAFVRYATAGSFTPLLGVPHFEIRNTSNVSSVPPRRVFIPPSGVARIQL